MINNELEPPFVGESRRLLVDGLLNLFDQVAESQKARWVSLEAPSGWGKTRIAHELYKRLAARQQSDYWPSSILSANNISANDVSSRRKRTHPDPDYFKRSAGSLPDFMWWGLACEMRNTGEPSQSLLEDLQQLEVHAPYLEAAWSSQAAFADKRFPSLAAARSALLEITEEIAQEGVDKVVETLISQSIPCMGLLVSLGKWGVGKAKEKKHQSEMVSSAGALHGQEAPDLLQDTVSTLSRLSRPGLPLVVFVEDLHRASSLTQELIERLVRTNASILIFSTTWPGTLMQVERFSKLIQDPVVADRVIRVQHDQALTDMFPKGASLSELDQQALQSIVMSYYPKADPETTRLLAERYNNPLPLELVCTLSKYRKNFEDGALKLSKEEIETLPRKVERLYWELWEELPEAVQQVLALATLGIPKTDSTWHKPLINQAIMQWAEQENYDSVIQVLQDNHIPHGWARLVEVWLHKFNEPDQLNIAKEYLVDDFLGQSQVDDFLESLAKTLSAEFKTLFEEGKEFFLDDQPMHQLMHKAWLVMSLHEEKYIDDASVLYAIRILQTGLEEQPLALGVLTAIGSFTENLCIKGMEFHTFNAKQFYGTALKVAGDIAQALEILGSLINNSEYEFLVSHPSFLRARSEYVFCLAASGSINEALVKANELLADQIRVLGPDHPNVLTTRSNITTYLSQSGSINEALVKASELLADQIRVLGVDHPDVLRTRSNISTYLSQSGSINETLVKANELLVDQIRVLGVDHPDVLRTRSNISTWLGDSGLVNEGLVKANELLEDRMRVLGPDHPDVLLTRSNIIFWLSQLGAIDETLENANELLEDQLRVLGPNHPNVLITRGNIIFCLSELGVINEALVKANELLEDQIRVLGVDHPNVLLTRSNIASYLGQSGSFDEALANANELLEDQIRVLGPDHPDVLLTRSNIASYLGQSGSVDEALANASELLEDQIRVLGVGHLYTQHTRNHIEELLNDKEES